MRAPHWVEQTGPNYVAEPRSFSRQHLPFPWPEGMSYATEGYQPGPYPHRCPIVEAVLDQLIRSDVVPADRLGSELQDC